jgi:phenylalanyl-tRNA synthetase beta chain
VRRATRVGEPPVETTVAAGIVAGRTAGWLKAGDPLDFHDAKRVVEELLRGFGIDEATYAAPEPPVPYLHPGVSATVRAPSGEALGVLGELHPLVARRLGLDARAFYFELAVDRLDAARPARRSVAPPRFPAAARDVSFWIDLAVTAASQRDAFLAAKDPLLREVVVLEDFRDPRHAPAGKKGMLWSMTYRADDRTLTDAEVDAAHARVVRSLEERNSIQVR